MQFIGQGTHQAQAKMENKVTTAAWEQGWEPLHGVRDLRVLLDEYLSMADHVNSLCKFCSYEMDQIEVFDIIYHMML